MKLACILTIVWFCGPVLCSEMPHETAGNLPEHSDSGPSGDEQDTGKLIESLNMDLKSLTLADVVRIALESNPATRSAWFDTKAAEAKYRSERAEWFPAIATDASASKTKNPAPPIREQDAVTSYGISATLTWLLFDFGGRSASIDNARFMMMASDWQYESILQNTILQVQTAYFQYMAMKSLLEAAKSNLKEAETNLEAARERQQVGLGTISDILTAQTVSAKAQLSVQSLEGNILTTRGALALSMGIPANTSFDIEADPDDVRIGELTHAVETLLQQAIDSRPDLKAARARYEAALANAEEMAAARYPSCRLTGSLSRTFYPEKDLHAEDGRSYADARSIGLTMHMSLFDGLADRYKTQQAQNQARAEAQKLKILEQQVIFQVFSAYNYLKTAAEQVKTSEIFLASARQSEEVALARYKEGVGSMIDLTAAQSLLADARAQEVEAKWSWFTALAVLAHDTGLLNSDGTNMIQKSITSDPGDQSNE